MNRTLLAALALLAGCLRTTGYEPKVDAMHVVPDAVPDAPPDAGPELPCSDPAIGYATLVPTGTSPAGPLEAFSYAVAYERGGFCPPAFVITFTPTPTGAGCANHRLDLAVQISWDGTTITSGTIPASASYNPGTAPTASTDQLVFDVIAIEKAGDTDARIAGRFGSLDPAWSVNVPVDLITQNAFFSCGP